MAGDAAVERQFEEKSSGFGKRRPFSRVFVDAAKSWTLTWTIGWFFLMTIAALSVRQHEVCDVGGRNAGGRIAGEENAIDAVRFVDRTSGCVFRQVHQHITSEQQLLANVQFRSAPSADLVKRQKRT